MYGAEHILHFQHFPYTCFGVVLTYTATPKELDQH